MSFEAQLIVSIPNIVQMYMAFFMDYLSGISWVSFVSEKE